MKTKQRLLSAAIAGLFCVSLSAVAEDIELFNSSPDLLISNGVPNVLIVLDNSANWNANNQKWKDNNNNFIPQGRSEARALRAVINSLPVGAVNVGLMMFVKSSSNPAGGYIRFGIRLMDATNKAALMKILDQLNIGGDDQVAAADADYSAVLFEAFKYFGGYGKWVNDASVAGSPVERHPFWSFGACRPCGREWPQGLHWQHSAAYADRARQRLHRENMVGRGCRCCGGWGSRQQHSNQLSGAGLLDESLW